ncbi:MAG: hypothetical protein ACK56I_26160, partial [bacterium]
IPQSRQVFDRFVSFTAGDKDPIDSFPQGFQGIGNRVGQVRHTLIGDQHHMTHPSRLVDHSATTAHQISTRHEDGVRTVTERHAKTRGLARSSRILRWLNGG